MSRFHYEPDPERGVFQEVAPGVRRMVAANASLMTYHGTNTYLIEAPEGLFVLDPGPADDARHFDAIISALGGRGAGIIVSHHHSDHFGAVSRLQSETGLRVHASANFADDTFRPDLPLLEGDYVAGLGVVHTPGHASDHLCFRRDDGVLFSGDHVMAWNSSIVMLPDGDMGAYCRQLERLIAAEDRLYLPGHGPALHDPTSYTCMLLQHRLQREDAIRIQIGKAPATPAEIAETVYRKTDKSLAWAAERNVEAHLDKLKQEGCAVRDGNRWRAI
ncbi:MBL fold metallo-hydrolase [Mesorhizobium sp. B4-1-4]|uniref:MBL fold metallo-hydrolase n=1 Tax=Mesorhizobium sp. B4-1-4 TaxID=2589888 RepID=UPI001AED72B0|nr:MBL fold metallo-hydrolase [Mesorhizobium sp. B4-1-4]UCI31930.1 MBL fold metallo-hydrolase [Mesorhizobium sp. B4-1-4]